MAVLVSGGLDSGILLWRLARRRRVRPVYVRCGHPWERAELFWLRALLRRVSPGARDLAILELPVGDLYGDHWSVTSRGVPDAKAAIDSNYLPGRNLLLLVKAVVLCAREGIRTVALAPLSENPFPDATPEFFRRFAVLASSALSCPIEVSVPFRRQSKASLIREAAGFPFELTFSCIAPRGYTHCGVCTKCAERRTAFAAAGVPDPTRYRLNSTSGRFVTARL